MSAFPTRAKQREAARTITHRRHAGGQHHRLAGGGTGGEQIVHQQLIGRDLVEIDERLQFRHRFPIERRAGKADRPRAAMRRQRRQMGDGQFPGAARPVLGASRQDFRREHAVDLEKLEFDRVAARIRSRIDESARAVQVAAMIGRGFGDENGRGFHLTISKERMAN
jgi:hypothetical protein